MAEDRPADRELLARLLNAIRNGDLEAARAALTEGAPVEGIRGAAGRWPLAEAIMEDDPAAVKFLLDHGADPNASYDGDPVPLMWVRTRFHEHVAEIVEHLLGGGADPDRRGWDDCTPSMHLVGQGPELVARLLRAGADPNAQTRNEEVPLSFCATWGWRAGGRALLEGGADPNWIARSFGWTLLHHAASGPNPGIVADLLAAGVDPDVEGVSGRSALHTALRWSHIRAARLLAPVTQRRGVMHGEESTAADLAVDLERRLLGLRARLARKARRGPVPKRARSSVIDWYHVLEYCSAVDGLRAMRSLVDVDVRLRVLGAWLRLDEDRVEDLPESLDAEAEEEDAVETTPLLVALHLERYGHAGAILTRMRRPDLLDQGRSGIQLLSRRLEDLAAVRAALNRS